MRGTVAGRVVGSSFGVGVAVVAGLALAHPAVASTPSPVPAAVVFHSPADSGIPRCVNDDYNDGSQALCYSVDVDGLVFVIDSTDSVVSRGE